MTNKSLPMPITVKPYLHQQQAFDFACMRFGLLPSDFRSNGVALLMEMGTGKTITSIGISSFISLAGSTASLLLHRCQSSVCGKRNLRNSLRSHIR